MRDDLPAGYELVSETTAVNSYGHTLVQTSRGWTERLSDPVDPKTKSNLCVKKGPSGKVGNYVEQLIRKGGMTDQEIVDMVKAKYRGASTSVKCVQWYRCKMRANGELPPLPKRKRRFLNELTFEVIESDGTVEVLTVKELIKKAKDIMIQDGAPKKVARETVYSVGTAVAFLKTQEYEILEQSAVEDC